VDEDGAEDEEKREIRRPHFPEPLRKKGAMSQIVEKMKMSMNEL
jgi:hypothetical protein